MEPTAYEHTTETRNEPAPIRPHVEYVKSVPGILKIAEIVLCILVLICASVDSWYHYGGAWVQFVAASAMITTAILFIFHLFDLLPRIPGPWPFIEFIYYCIFCVLFIITAIVTAVRANRSDAIGAACFFTFAALVVYMVDTYFMYRGWQEFQHHRANFTGTSVTTTTTTTYESKTQY